MLIMSGLKMGKRIILKSNDSVHSCDVCLHGLYNRYGAVCDGKNRETLVRPENVMVTHHSTAIIYVPKNCPLLKTEGRERVIFT